MDVLVALALLGSRFYLFECCDDDNLLGERWCYAGFCVVRVLYFDAIATQVHWLVQLITSRGHWVACVEAEERTALVSPHPKCVSGNKALSRFHILNHKLL